MKVQTLFPEGKFKALTFSYDDGNVADRRLVEIFNRYGMKGTFNLCSFHLTGDNEGVIRTKPQCFTADMKSPVTVRIIT